MRDKKKGIKGISENFKCIRDEYPNLRFGQLILNLGVLK